MNLETFNRIQALKLLGGSVDTADLFSLELEDLVAAARAAGDLDLVEKLQTIGKHQIAYLLTQHINMQIQKRLAGQQAANGECQNVQ